MTFALQLENQFGLKIHLYFDRYHKSVERHFSEFVLELIQYLLLLDQNLILYVDSRLSGLVNQASSPETPVSAIDSPCTTPVERISNPRTQFWNPQFCCSHNHKIDLVVSLGGDGTVLYTSWLFQNSPVRFWL